MIRQLIRRREQSADAGFSLIELIVATSVFLMILGIITASIVSMMSQTRRETGQSDNLDAARKIIQTLDKTARYANDITTPATGTDGAYYVEYRTGNSGQQQTCWQWRYVPSSGLVQERSWKPLVIGTGQTGLTSWVLEGTGISLSGSTPIWSISASGSSAHEGLGVTFVTTHGGGPAVSQTNTATFTAINTSSPTPLASSICTEVGRP